MNKYQALVEALKEEHKVIMEIFTKSPLVAPLKKERP